MAIRDELGHCATTNAAVRRANLGYSRATQMTGEHKQHFTGRHLVNRRLTGPTSAKDTRHHEIALESGHIEYLPGDALGAHAANDPALVERVVRAVGATGDEPITTVDGVTMSLAQALSDVYNLTTPSRRLIELVASRGAAELAPLLEKANAEHLKHYVSGWDDPHDVLDVLEDHPHARVTATELVEALRKTLPRLYSVASSLKAHARQVHLLVVSVKYQVRGRERLGICSTWFADRWAVGATAGLYLQNQQKHFAMPADPATPMIMIGPGTGLAPFRAFIEERLVVGAPGRNWLFFGEQHRASDFFYADELCRYADRGAIKLDVAFSRDQPEKVYVQHRLRDHAREIWSWLEDGAEIFVCGDKERMAADVDRALHEIVETQSGRSPEAAHAYIDALKQAKRYKRDVY
jgi:sulfite reductase (NADPH) flavoprotein alpha-component